MFLHPLQNSHMSQTQSTTAFEHNTQFRATSRRRGNLLRQGKLARCSCRHGPLHDIQGSSRRDSDRLYVDGLKTIQ
jgi:hypothetical protein